MDYQDTSYIPRISDFFLNECLQTFGATVIEGPKWCGKTTSAQQFAQSQFLLADPAGGYQNKRLAQLDPSEALRGKRPLLIDEWQEVPSIWDAVRFECDQAQGAPGQFILTGSATPLSEERPFHSGAGRMGKMRMDTMTLSELGLSTKRISLKRLLEQEDPEGSGSLTVRDLAEIVCRGGWPATISMPLKQAMMIPRSYIDVVAEEEIQRSELGIERNPLKVLALVKSLARNESTLASKRTLLADTAEANGGRPLSEASLNAYINVLKRMFFIEDIPAWSPALRSPVRIRSSAKHHFADPSLAAAAMGATPDTLVADVKTLGLLFESLAAHDLIVYARAMDARVYHYNDNTNLEVDLIVEKRNGAWGAFEVKLGYQQEDAAAKSLNHLEVKMTERGERPAAVKAVIVGVGGIAHRREDGVCVIPIDALTA